MAAKKAEPPPVEQMFTIWLRNHTSRDDDESIKVRAKTKEEAREKAQYDKSRFSIRAVFTAEEARHDYYG